MVRINIAHNQLKSVKINQKESFTKKQKKLSLAQSYEI